MGPGQLIYNCPFPCRGLLDREVNRGREWPRVGPHQRPKEEECPRAARSASPDATVQQQPWGVDNQEAAGLEYLGASQGVLGHGFAFQTRASQRWLCVLRRPS